MVFQMGKYVLLSTAVCGVVTHHDNIERTLGRQFAGELPVVSRYADGPHLVRLTQPAKLFGGLLGEMLLLGHAQEEEDIDIVGA